MKLFAVLLFPAMLLADCLVTMAAKNPGGDVFVFGSREGFGMVDSVVAYQVQRCQNEQKIIGKNGVSVSVPMDWIIIQRGKND